MKKFVAWRRVSTKQQGASGLGLAAQKQIIEYFVQAEGGELVADYSDVYTGKDLEGCTELKKAMARCREEGATLIIAKSDRFRNTVEALGIYDQMEGNIFFCDLPKTDKFTLTLFFALAEREALLVSIRTKQALAAKKAGGVKLGRPKGCDISKAITASSVSRRQQMIENKSNKTIWQVCQLCTERGTDRRQANFEKATKILVDMGIKTSKGNDLTLTNVRQTWYNLRKVFGDSKDTLSKRDYQRRLEQTPERIHESNNN